MILSPHQAFELAMKASHEGQLADAERLLRGVLAALPGEVAALGALAVVQAKQGRLDDALASLDASLAADPNRPETHNDRGVILSYQGRFVPAEAAFTRAVQLRPQYAEAWNNLGNAKKNQGKLDEARMCYQRALDLDPNHALAHHNLGNLLHLLNRFDDAVICHRRALQLAPQYAPAHQALASTLLDQGCIEEAIAELRAAVQLAPGDSGFASDLILALYLDPHSSPENLEQHKRNWNTRFGTPASPASRDRDPDRPLRVGYVSADFRDHVVGRTILPLLVHADRQAFTAFCYAAVPQPDRWTEKFRARCDHWRDIGTWTDEAVAEAIRNDGIDILVDLGQHTKGNRLLVFAKRPAPVQVSFAGYPDNTGSSAIEYRISDPVLEQGSLHPPLQRTFDSEKVHLIDCFWHYSPEETAPEVNVLPSLEKGYVTFGSLNNFCKVNSQVLKLWAQVLTRVPGSRLRLLAGPGSHRQRTLDAFACESIAPARVQFVEPGTRAEYLAHYRQIDIVLDPFPFDGHTTSLDALWMGSPVITLPGQTRLSRGAASILHALKLPDFVTSSPSAYVETAARWATDLSGLAAMRATLRSRMQGSILLDEIHFARQLHGAYRAMWREWCGRA